MNRGIGKMPTHLLVLWLTNAEGQDFEDMLIFWDAECVTGCSSTVFVSCNCELLVSTTDAPS